MSRRWGRPAGQNRKLENQMTNAGSVHCRHVTISATLLAAIAWAAPAQVTIKPIENDPIRIDGGLKPRRKTAFI
jgi:hypothetical protein